MINTNEIEAGDKVRLRGGSVLVAWEDASSFLRIGSDYRDSWKHCGAWGGHDAYKNLDIIRIEKAPKPVVRECYIAIRNGGLELWHIKPRSFECEDAYKITITDGEATIERVK